jgi:hypothetical protein
MLMLLFINVFYPRLSKINFMFYANVVIILTQYEITDVDGRIILRWIFRKWEGVVGTGWSWLRIGTDGGHL